MTKRRLVLSLLGGILVVFGIGICGFVFWASSTPEPMAKAFEALESTGEVSIRQDAWIVFEPTAGAAECGMIFYPGGRVDPRSYAPLARGLAEVGMLTVIVPMPLNLAFLAPGRAGAVIEAFPEIDTWVISGHSLGGVFAANYSSQNPQEVDGLVLLASYPGSGDDLSSSTIPVVSMYGTLDGLTAVEEIEASRTLLPEAAVFYPIEGGNHAQFGWYGEQPGDNPAGITREQQQEQVLTKTLDLLDNLGCGL